MGYECGLCGHVSPTLDLIKEHIAGNHEDEFYSEYFDDWADNYIMIEEER